MPIFTSSSLGRVFGLRRRVRNDGATSPTVQGPNTELHDESRGRVAFECVDLTLAFLEYAAGPIPIAGQPLNAVIGGLRKLMENGDMSSNASASEPFTEETIEVCSEQAGPA